MRWLSHSKIFPVWRVLLLVCSAPIAAQEWQAQSEEEALFLRRIADFWKEGEYQIVKSQIEEFLREYPESSFAQTLHASLGDLYVRGGNFKGALMQYSRIVDPAIADKIFLNRMQCLLELQWFATLADECEAYLQQEQLAPEHKQRATHLLAISLYQQCLNSTDDMEALQRLASRALPYFQELLQDALSDEIAQASAHLCTILQNYPGAAEIYLHLADTSESDREEMLFQAALFQANYDKPLALSTFRKLSEAGRSRSADAAYNALVLSYDCKEYEEILLKRELICAQIPKEKTNDARFFFGKSYLQLKQYPEALREFLAFTEKAEPSESLHDALIGLLDVSYRLGEPAMLEKALERFSLLYPKDPELPKGYLSQALLLKKGCQTASARNLFKKIQSDFPETPECREALFEEIHLNFHEKGWERCRELCQTYLERYADSDRAPFAWRFLAAASANLCSSNPTEILREQLANDLEALLSQKNGLTDKERSDWIFLQAKTCYELKWHENAAALLEKLLNEDPQNANAHLLFALCCRDGFRDTERFCSEAEKALLLGANLLDATSLHFALFNGYLDQKNEEQAADHLYQTLHGTAIRPENLLWLADYYDRSGRHADRAAHALEAFLASNGIDADHLEEETLVFEKALVKLAELYGKMEEYHKQLSLLESLKQQQDAHPSWPWQEESSVELQLAEQYEKLGRKELALTLYDTLAAKSSTLRTFSSAAAALKSARLRVAKLDVLPKADLFKALALLKTLSLQKNLANEPIHLEASLEYIDLQTTIEASETRMQKRLALLEKAKENFEHQDDLLSRDYHAGRAQSPEKDRLYHRYLALFEAEILSCKLALSKEENERSLLLQNAKKLYEDILLNPPTDYLAGRARRNLEQIAQ